MPGSGGGLPRVGEDGSADPAMTIHRTQAARPSFCARRSSSKTLLLGQHAVEHGLAFAHVVAAASR